MLSTIQEIRGTLTFIEFRTTTSFPHLRNVRIVGSSNANPIQGKEEFIEMSFIASFYLFTFSCLYHTHTHTPLSSLIPLLLFVYLFIYLFIIIIIIIIIIVITIIIIIIITIIPPPHPLRFFIFPVWWQSHVGVSWLQFPAGGPWVQCLCPE